MRPVPALVAVLALHALFFDDVLFGGRSLSPAPYTYGLTSHGPYGAPPVTSPPHLLDVEGAAWVDEPSPYLAAAEWRSGEPPLWTSAEGLGAPLAANLNSGAGNPLHLPLALWPGAVSADVFALARLALLALGTAFYLGELTLAPAATLVGAATVAYGGYAMAWIVHHPLSAELFLPLMLAGFERGRRGIRGGWALLALAGAGSLAGGKLQASLLCLLLVLTYAAARSHRRHGGSGAATLAATLAAAALGVALAAYLLVPAAELMTRASGLALGARSALAGFTLEWPTLAAVALPRLFVPPGRIFPDGLPLPPAIGVIASVLAVVGATTTRSPLRAIARFYALWAMLLLLRNAGLFGSTWMTGLPVVGAVFFLKYTFTAAFALAVLTAIGVDAVARGAVARRDVTVAIAATLVVLAALVAVAAARGLLVGRLSGRATAAALVGAVVLVLWQQRRLRAGAAAVSLAATIVLELRSLAPATHPRRVDPYRPPAYVEFLRRLPAARVLAAGVLMPPLTSGAAGLRDLRAIDVLTPGTTYAFFTRLVSFCAHVIHFTVDPDLPLAATSPAVDLAGVRWIVSSGRLVLGDLDARVIRQVGHERVARLLAGMRAIRTDGADLALGAVDGDGAGRFAISMLTPFALEIEAESEAPELAWDLHAASDGARIAWHVAAVAAGGVEAATEVGHDAIVVENGESWRETRVALGAAGVRRRVRVRVEAESLGAGRRARVDLGDLGFSEGAAAEATRRAAALRAHRVEAAALTPVFDDSAVGAVVYENSNALPRAFRVREVEPVASADAALTRLADGFDFRSRALVATSAATIAAAEEIAGVLAEADAGARARAGVAADASGADRTAVVKDDAGGVTIATDGPERALLVLGDLDYPGWHAAVDGRPVPILPTDGALRGVVVPPGPHCLEFRYAPRSWLRGLALTLVAAALLPVLARRAARAHAKIVPPFERVL